MPLNVVAQVEAGGLDKWMSVDDDRCTLPCCWWSG